MEEEARELLEVFKPHSMAYWCDMQGWDESSREVSAVECALLSVKHKHKGIINVLGELKARGELSEKIYLKAINDLNEEKKELIEEIEKI